MCIWNDKIKIYLKENSIDFALISSTITQG